MKTNAIDRAVKKLMTASGTPGASLAVLHGDEIYIQGYGVKRIGESDPVTPDTLFANASTTKAFTTAAMALLVDEKILDWDAPVRTYLPSFRLSDPHADALVTPRDLVCHRTGMPRHDWLWYRSAYGRDEILRRIAFAPPTAPFRGLYQYNNICFTAAGEVVRAASGAESFEAFLRGRLLIPLGMARTVPTCEAAQADPDHAEPHKKIKNKIITTPWLNFDAVGACGTLNSSAREMANWLRFQLSGGVAPDGTRLLSESALRETHTPQMVVRMEEATRERYPFIAQMSYALGWSVWNWREGRRLLTHGGAIDGFRSQVALLPDEKIGIAVFTNLGQPFVEYVRNAVFDILLDLKPLDVVKMMREETAKAEEVARKTEGERRETRKKRKPLPLPLDAFVGTYSEPAYGTAIVSRDGEALRLKWNTFDLELSHLTFTTFLATLDPLANDQTEPKFDLNPGGNVTALRFLDGVFKRDEPPAAAATA